MDNALYLTVVLPLIFLFTSFLNLTMLIYLISKFKNNSIEKQFNMNSKEFELIQRQYLFLQVRTEVETKRLDAIEKIISAIVIASHSGDSSGGVMH
tara:strand:- start:616 stop:903 length:288 start_codon:yes stop_codon:yes gene_type:complete